MIVALITAASPSPDTSIAHFGAWFSTLDQNTRAALISFAGVITAGLLSATIALFGYIFTARNTRNVSLISASLTRDLKSIELQQASRIKIADWRIDWIEHFRSDSAELCGMMYERSVARKHHERLKQENKTEENAKKVEEAVRRHNSLSRDVSRLKARLSMRINPESEVVAEQELDKILRAAEPKETSEAMKQRKEIQTLTRTILNSEWKKAKQEIDRSISATNPEKA